MSTPHTPDPPTGPCGKWIHPTMDAARRALRSVRKRKGEPEEKGSAYRDRSEPPARRRFQSG